MASAVFYSIDVKASRNRSIPDGIFAGRYKRYGWLYAMKMLYLVKGERVNLTLISTIIGMNSTENNLLS
jgi:hypothetical protein